MSAPLITLEHVDVDLAGLRVLHDITWQVPRGEHWGIVGENGSGKSTLLGLILGSVWPAPDRGTRRYDFGAGEETDAVRARNEIVLVGHELQDRYARLSWNFTAVDVVLSGIYRTDVPRRRPSAAEKQRALVVLQRLGCDDLAARKFLELSRGEQRRVLIARAVAFEPTVLLLDEPASGLDPRARIEIRQLLKHLRTMGKTIMVSSHILPELADICNKIGIIERGELLVNSDVEEVMRRVRRQPTLKIGVVGDSAPAARLLETQPKVERVAATNGVLTVTLAAGETDYSHLPSALVGAGFRLTLFKEEEVNLETAFMELTKGITA